MLASLDADVRFAAPDDEDDLVTMLRAMHADPEWPMRDINGRRLAFSEEKARGTVQRVIMRNRNEPDAGQAWIGVLGAPGNLVGSVCVRVTEPWLEDGHLLGEQWNWVYPQHRRSPAPQALVTFSVAMADSLGLPLVTGVMIQEQRAKERLYERKIGAPIGSMFLYTNHAAGTV